MASTINTNTNTLTAARLYTDGSENIGIGLLSISSITTGQNNIAIGISSLASTTSGDKNTSIGYQAMTTNT